MEKNMKKQLALRLYDMQKEIQAIADDYSSFTANALADVMQMSRTVVSQYLNELFSTGQLIKINSRPVYFISKEALTHTYNVQMLTNIYDSIQAFQRDLQTATKDTSIFHKLTGAQGSLHYCVEQCKAALSYPKNGLPILLQGATGTGKSYIAQLLYEQAVCSQMIDANGKFVTVNCSEYANNPELLLTNLFGYKKGAYTGADKDKQGLIAMADGGVLFLDEVHGLKPECQEKIFLFMDKGIYHMVGDNETWHSANVRFVFATTENPEHVLLKTLLRRIPIIVKIPSLAERSVQEKKALIYKIIQEEKEKVAGDIQISVLAYQSIVNFIFTGNVGQLKNCIRVCVANAFMHMNDDNRVKDMIEIHVNDLPEYLLQNSVSDNREGIYDDKTLLDANALMPSFIADSKYLTLQQGLLHQYQQFEHKVIDFDTCLAISFLKLEQYVDYLFFANQSSYEPKEELVHNLVSNICGVVTRKHTVNDFSNNEIKIMSKFIYDVSKSASSCTSFLRKNKVDLHRCLTYYMELSPKDYLLVQDMQLMIENSLNINMNELERIALCLFMRYFNREMAMPQIPVVILAHGYSIASGIAEVANQLLHHNMFDAIDMPIESHFEAMTSKLSAYIKKLEGCKEVIVMVDMGSLEDIHKYIGTIRNVDIGVINNVTTKLALDIGSMIMEGSPLQKILEEASQRNIHNFVIIKNRLKPYAILTVCATGFATAEKISMLIENSFPKKINVEVVPYEFDSLCIHAEHPLILDKYNVLFIVGTMNPSIPDIPFFSIEEIIEQRNISHINELLKPLFTGQELQVFNQNIIKNFSLDNLINYLTILNPEKIITFVEAIIRQLQEETGVQFTSNITIGLYLHISCLIERLVIDKYVTNFADLEAFESSQQEFIAIVQRCFTDVKKSYNVSIPTSEIGYLYEYVYRYNAHTVEKEQKSDEKLLAAMGFIE